MKNLEKEKMIEPYLEVALGYIILALMIKLYFYFEVAGFLSRIALYAPTPLLLLTLILSGYLVKKLASSLGPRGKNIMSIAFGVCSLSFIMTPLFYFLI